MCATTGSVLQSVKKVYIINAPLLFRGLWRIVKPWLHPNTVAAIEICSSDHMATFRANGIGRASLPESVGGTTPSSRSMRGGGKGELHEYFSNGCKLPQDLATQRRRQKQQEADRANGATEGLLPPGHGTMEPEPEPEVVYRPADIGGGITLELDLQATEQEQADQDPDSIRTPEAGYATPQESFHRAEQRGIGVVHHGGQLVRLGNSGSTNGNRDGSPFARPVPPLRTATAKRRGWSCCGGPSKSPSPRRR